jgi:hypothetical protein
MWVGKERHSSHHGQAAASELAFRSRLFAWYRLRMIAAVLSPQFGNKRLGELERHLIHLQLAALPHPLITKSINSKRA